MTTRYAPFEPSDGITSDRAVRIVLKSGQQYTFEEATFSDDVVSGNTIEHRFISVDRNEIDRIEHADGKRLDTQAALRLTGIVLTLVAIVAISCAVDKDCTGDATRDGAN